MRRLVRGALFLAVFLASAPAVFAQATGIAGVARDTSGAVLPGVTVEASSPALIEKVRSATTDAQGQYRILDLRPGSYSVTFTLPGFATFKREGVDLPAQFVATVNADMKVGGLEESITVSGATPLVDTQNVIKRNVVQKDTIDAMPTSKNWSTIGVMTVGVFSNQNDVGGSAGEHQNQLKAHGGSFNDRLVQLDGLMLANMACNYSCTGLSTNDASTQELSYEFGAISAETAGGGVRVNIIPKEGGNKFSGSGFFNFANHSLQGNNIDDTLRGQGITTGDSINRIYDLSGAFGGPLKQDKLWFWTAHRYWGYEQIRTNTFQEINPTDFVFDPDRSRPGTETQKNKSSDVRLTWQISPKNRFSVYYDYAPRTTDGWTLVSTIQPDAAQFQNIPLSHFETFTFRSTLSAKMLFEAAMGNMSQTWTREPARDSLTSKDYPVTELTTGINFRAYNATFSENYTSLRSYRSSLSYVTGSHAFKFGMTNNEGPADTRVWTSKDTAITVNNGVPFQVTVRTTPYTAHERLVADLGLYAMDTWTIKRLTVNAGIRFDYLNNRVDAQDAPGGTWIGPRHFDAMNNVPNYKDFGPRLGAAYDLFGNGKTAIKGSVSRYVQTSTVSTARLLNPLNTSVNTATRSWSDLNTSGQNCYAATTSDKTGCDGIPRAERLGPLSNSSFGQVNVATVYDPGTINGWAKRRYNWEHPAASPSSSARSCRPTWRSITASRVASRRTTTLTWPRRTSAVLRDGSN
ncbi:MAG: TonB-dependent receptor [Vicinamibacterales bacterium]